MGILAVVLVGGFFIDLWAHSHGKVDDTFFTPWHAILYTGALLHGLVLLNVAVRGRRDGLPVRRALPHGYGLSFIGAGLFLVAGVFDLIWHGVFGFEADTEALLSPPHLALAASGVFMVAGPVRSAWHKGPPIRFPHWFPWVLALTMLLSILTAFTEYAHPAIEVWPAPVIEGGESKSVLIAIDPDGSSQTRLALDDADDYWMPSTFPDGRIVVSTPSDGVGALTVMNQDGSDPVVVWQGAGIFNHPDVSPDGTKIAFTAESEAGNSDIYVMEADGGHLRRLTDDGATDWGPAWGPGSDSITFVSDRLGSADLYVIPAAGGEAARLTDLEGDEGAPDWSPGGSLLAFEAIVDGDLDIYVMSRDGSDPVALTDSHYDESAPAWSPDGSKIAFASGRDGPIDVYLINQDGSQEANLTRNPAAHEGWAGIAWAADGSAILTNSSAWDDGWSEPYFREALGVASLLIQGALLAGALLIMMKHGALPLGSITLIMTVNGALMTVISDNYWYIAVVAIAGVLGDVAAYLTRDRPMKWRARLLTPLVLAIWYACYLAVVAFTQGGIGWSVHMIVGAPVLAGVVGLLMCLVVFPAESARHVEGLDGSM
jgi:Tol biopolymer transport system component